MSKNRMQMGGGMLGPDPEIAAGDDQGSRALADETIEVSAGGGRSRSWSPASSA